MKQRNEPIGEVECPHKGCTEIAKVFRFRPRGAPERKTVFTGKLYCECPKHGRIGGDGNATINEYVLSNGKLWEPKSPEAPADASPPKSPKTVAKPPQTQPAQPVKSSGPVDSNAQASRWRPLIDLE